MVSLSDDRERVKLSIRPLKFNRADHAGVPALDLEIFADGFQFADETRDSPVSGIARMVGHAATDTLFSSMNLAI